MPATTQIIYVGQGFMLSVETVNDMAFTKLITFPESGGFKIQNMTASKYLPNYEMKEYNLTFIESLETMICRSDIPIQYIILD